jgi:ribosomal protein L34E
MSKTELRECPHCGKPLEVLSERRARSHVNVCGKSRDTPYSGVCAMCGDEYESYLDHLAECDGGES